MKHKSINFSMYFPKGMPKGTAQQKGETIRYKRNGHPYIQHYSKANVESAASLFKYQLKKHKPETPFEGPVSLEIYLYFDIKDKRLWGRSKDTRPDLDNFVKLLIDQMTQVGYWTDDSKVVELFATKRYDKEASIHIIIDDIEEMNL